MNRKAYWEQIWVTKPPDSLSWFQPEPTTSLRLLEAAGLTPAT
jgi:hypothetical protein